MKLSKIITVVLICSCVYHVNAQGKAPEKEKKYYYKDTTFEFNGAKYEISRILATEAYFKFKVNVTNISDKFIVITPYDVYSYTTDPKIRRSSATVKTAVIAPRYTKSFTLNFKGPDYREPYINVDFTKIQYTGKVEAVYQIADMNIFADNSKQTGPVKVVLDNNKKEDKNGYRLIIDLQYTGGKFLSFFQNNIVLKTKDGGNYVNTGKKAGVFNKGNSFSYEMGKPSQREFLFFPVTEDKVSVKNEPVLTFKDVFKEYSLTPVDGPKLKLRQGTVEDFNGSNKKSDIDDSDEDK